MLTISSRKGFGNTIFFSPDFLVQDLDIDENIIKSYTTDELKEYVRGKRVCILIHGYNSKFNDAMDSYQTIETVGGKTGLLPDEYDLFIGYLWPGSNFAPAFWMAEWRANRCGPKLAMVVEAMNSTAKFVDVQTHSLGARVALESVQSGAKYRNVILTAAAVKHRTYELPDGAYTTTPAQVYSFFSANDPVLKDIFPLSAFSRALGHRAIDQEKAPHNLTQIDCSDFVHAHGDYRRNYKYYGMWKKAINRPPVENPLVIAA